MQTSRRPAQMIPYANLRGDSGVRFYASGEDFIAVQFVDGATYYYDVKSTGRKAIKRMQVLAKQGSGLATFISQHVRDAYAFRSTRRK